LENSTLTAPPKISVIIPVYNQANYLEDALQSVLAQTYHDYEIVVVNDGSTDASEEIANRYREKIRYIYQENRGLAGARNTGIRESKGELIALLDSDDIWLPDYLERMVALTEENPQAAVFYCAARCVDEQGLLLKQIVGYQPVESADLYKYLLRSNFIIPSTITARKTAIEQINCFDQNLRSCEDWDLWLILLSSGYLFCGIPDVLTHYRIHVKSLSADVLKMQYYYKSVVEKHFGQDDHQYDLWDEYKRLAFCGFYRYQLLTNIRRQNNWQGAEILRKAILVDPIICSDIDLFYELAFGNQPVGYQGMTFQFNLVENAEKIESLLFDLFSLEDNSIVQSHRKVIYGTAYKAIGLVAYNTEQFPLSRKYFFRALLHQPGLLFHQKWIVGRYLKSFLGLSRRFILQHLTKLKLSGME
jgi:glycosyltransferase involved in cell wall biosynthesis